MVKIKAAGYCFLYGQVFHSIPHITPDQAYRISFQNPYPSSSFPFRHALHGCVFYLFYNQTRELILEVATP